MPNTESSGPVMEELDSKALRGQRVALLLAKSSITGAADTELQFLCERLAASGRVAVARYACSEQGDPSLRESLRRFAAEGVSEVILLPLLLPMEPGFRLWIARSIERWRSNSPHQEWPRVRVAEHPARAPGADAWLRGWLDDGFEAPEAKAPPRAPEGSIVPTQRRRVLVCQGGPCNDAGAAVIWAHLRNEQKRLNLRSTGVGVMTCKTTCLGPCHLAPVLQVFPEGTYYGGIDEDGMDRIVQRHLLDGYVVSELAYPPASGRQVLRVRERTG